MQFGRLLPFSAAVSGTAVAVKTGRSRVYGWQVLNNTAAIAYVQVFNKALADVTLGTTAPDYVIPLAANGESNVSFGGIGIDHDTGITIAATTGRANSTGAACDVLMEVGN